MMCPEEVRCVETFYPGNAEMLRRWDQKKKDDNGIA
jgi:hypothetical protein